MLRSTIALAALVGLCAASCLPNQAGANPGARSPGSGDSGIQVGSFRGEIAVSPDGRFALYRHADRLLALELSTRLVRTLPGILAPGVLTFWPGGKGVFVVCQQPTAAPEPIRRLVSVDLATWAIVWQKPLYEPARGMQLAADGSRLVLWGDRLQVLDPTQGELRGSFEVAGQIVDVDALGGVRLLVVTEDPRRRAGSSRSEDSRPARSATALQGPTTVIHVRNLLDASPRCTVRVANCADELVVTPGGTRGLLAPTFCGRDPVTVIDLASCGVAATLPGFGPVALVNEGKTAVAFVADDVKEGASGARGEAKSSGSRFGLSFIDTTTLAAETLALGEGLPRYATTPKGGSLVIDSAAGMMQIRLLPLATRVPLVVRGPAIALRNFVITPDERHLFAVLSGLYDLDLTQGRIDSLPLTCLPFAINITPDGKTVLLLDEQGRVHLMDPATHEIVAVIPPPSS